MAESHGVDMAEAYQLLLRRVAAEGATLTTTAQAVIDEAQHRPLT